MVSLVNSHTNATTGVISGRLTPDWSPGYLQGGPEPKRATGNAALKKWVWYGAAAGIVCSTIIGGTFVGVYYSVPRLKC
jgi:hypothetical protein